MLYNKARKRKGMKHMNIKAAIWDLDGTLLNTLDDLAASTNAALTENGLPTHTVDEVRMFVGNGIGKLIERAVPDGRDNPKFQAVYDAFVAHYGAHSRDHTKPYDGILPMLDALAAKGVKLAIVSNKIDFAVKALSRDYFPGNRMQVAMGDDPSRRRKPAPDSVLEAMRQMGVTREETVYVGDSDVDVETARNAGVTCCAVSWGFRSVESLKDAGAEQIAANAAGAAGHAGGAVKPPYDAVLVLGVELTRANDAPTDELAAPGDGGGGSLSSGRGLRKDGAVRRKLSPAIVGRSGRDGAMTDGRQACRKSD